jgi:hypothetical protein
MLDHTSSWPWFVRATCFAGLGALLAACTTRPSEEGLHSRSMASTASSFSVSVPAAALEAGAPLLATSGLELGDRVRVGATGARLPVASTGAAVLRVGVDAIVGSVTGGGAVDLRDRARVEGNLRYAGVLTKGNQTVVTGTALQAPLGTMKGSVRLPV